MCVVFRRMSEGWTAGSGARCHSDSEWRRLPCGICSSCSSRRRICAKVNCCSSRISSDASFFLSVLWYLPRTRSSLVVCADTCSQIVCFICSREVYDAPVFSINVLCYLYICIIDMIELVKLKKHIVVGFGDGTGKSERSKRRDLASNV